MGNYLSILCHVHLHFNMNCGNERLYLYVSRQSNGTEVWELEVLICVYLFIICEPVRRSFHLSESVSSSVNANSNFNLHICEWLEGLDIT